MFWITQVILKDVKIGYGETAVLRHYHQDAVDLYNLCCDLRRVCETLAARSERLKRQDLEPGALVKAMMASRAHARAAAFEAMRDRPFVIETKFDGERIRSTEPTRAAAAALHPQQQRFRAARVRRLRPAVPRAAQAEQDAVRVRRRAGGVEHARRRVRAVRVLQEPFLNAIRDNRGGTPPFAPRTPEPTRGGAARAAFASRGGGGGGGGGATWSVRGRGRFDGVASRRTIPALKTSTSRSRPGATTLSSAVRRARRRTSSWCTSRSTSVRRDHSVIDRRAA